MKESRGEGERREGQGTVSREIAGGGREGDEPERREEKERGEKREGWCRGRCAGGGRGEEGELGRGERRDGATGQEE
jgi:hypothetical protein